MKELEIDERTIFKQEDLSHYISQFYANLYSSKPHFPGTAEAQRKSWESVPSQITKDMNAKMTQELTLEKVTEAITSLPKSKAPGHDGLSTKFFQGNVEETIPMLLLTFRAMLSQGLTLEFINKGMITLIPKFGDHSKLGNWRPITFLGSIYKILAKILARKIQVHLPFVIKPN